MNETVLFMAPGTCARVSCIALEEIGLPFETRVIRFLRGEHKSPAYKRFNPKGKVPALVMDGATLTENVAILCYLHERFPEARLLPPASDALARARQVADLAFCASTLHPLVSRIRFPQMVAGPEVAAGVYLAAAEAMKEYFQLVENRLGESPWWYGDAWTVMDAYLYWVFWRVEGAGFNVEAYPRYTDHARRMEQRPAVQRALAREEELDRQLEAEGLSVKPTIPPGVT